MEQLVVVQTPSQVLEAPTTKVLRYFSDFQLHLEAFLEDWEPTKDSFLVVRALETVTIPSYPAYEAGYSTTFAERVSGILGRQSFKRVDSVINVSAVKTPSSLLKSINGPKSNMQNM
ncbi:hypothetical protein HID58_083958 [Brassica napus]|uniref:Uncharacterized protein n=1 Tax=Brassica napus TaxID=3708 RepID=A0ABQ7XEH4_BRANA|nr:hypothetical protein HID58_083958 [Brassica napus]